MKYCIPIIIMALSSACSTNTTNTSLANKSADCQDLEVVKRNFTNHFDIISNHMAGWNAMNEGIDIFNRMMDTQQVMGLPFHERSALARLGKAMQAFAKTSNEVSDRLGRESSIAFSAREAEVEVQRAFVEILLAFACK